jgi:ubiquinone/menaquinone biosynthesis C-methylase UbiE
VSQSSTNLRSNEYVLGTDERELERLGLQHRLWSDAAHALWRRAGIQPGSAVLDIGCGPGFALLDLARIVTAQSRHTAPGRVVGVDASRPYLAHLGAQAAAQQLTNISTVQADLHDLDHLAEVEPGSFDAAYARWVFCFVSDPAAVLRGAARALKPGGRLIVQDYFNYESMSVAPRRESFTKAVLATGRSWRTRGGDPDIIGRLPGLLPAAGLRLIHLDVHQRLARPGEQMWHWPQTFWENFLPTLVHMGLLNEDDQAAWLRDWDELSRTPGAFIMLPAVFDLIAEKVA